MRCSSQKLRREVLRANCGCRYDSGSENQVPTFLPCTAESGMHPSYGVEHSKRYPSRYLSYLAPSAACCFHKRLFV